MKIKTLFIAVALFAMTFAASAQNYRTGIGARLGAYQGITLKHFVSSSTAVEAIGALYKKGFAVTGLYEFQKNLQGGLDWYLGPGVHVGFYDYDNYWYGPDGDRKTGAYTNVGVDFILGLEYTFSEIPFNIGLDWKPTYEFSPSTGFGYDGIALSLRYTIK